MSDKELLYQLLAREVNQILGNLNPTLRMFSNTATNYIINIIDPYVDAFLANQNSLNTEMASEFVKEEINKKVDSFIQEFNKRKNMNDDL